MHAQTPYSKNLEKQANGGNIEAMVSLGKAYLYGNGTAKNEKNAEKWLHKAADKNSVEAFDLLIDGYGSWDLIANDPKKAMKWAKKGAETGIPQLQLRYAKMCSQNGMKYTARVMAERAVNNGCLEAIVPTAYYCAKTRDYYNAYLYSALALNLLPHMDLEQQTMIRGTIAVSLAGIRRPDFPIFANVAGVADNDAQYLIARNLAKDENEMAKCLDRMDADSPQYALLKAVISILSRRSSDKNELIRLVRKAADAGIPDAVAFMAIITSPKEKYSVYVDGYGFDDARFMKMASYIKQDLNDPSLSHEFYGWLKRTSQIETIECALVNVFGNALCFSPPKYVPKAGLRPMCCFDITVKFNCAKKLIEWKHCSAMAQDQLAFVLNGIYGQSREALRSYDEEYSKKLTKDPSDGNLVASYYNMLSKIIGTQRHISDNNKAKIPTSISAATEDILKYFPANDMVVSADLKCAKAISDELYDARFSKHVESNHNLVAQMILSGRLTPSIENLQLLASKVDKNVLDDLKTYAYQRLNFLL
jgi:TPR repeat protein